MISTMMKTADIRGQFIELYEQDHSGPTVELIGSSFIADKPAIFGEPNEEYIEREIEWYMTGSLNVHDIPGKTPKIWKQVASKDGLINSNYGFLVFSEDNGSQYDNVLETLITSPDGRRGTMVYTRPAIHTQWNTDGMSDFICTNAVNYFIRDGALHAVVQMRSNDVVFGYRNDFAWQHEVQSFLLEDLAEHGKPVDRGVIIWQAASLHVYSRHYKLIEEEM